MKIKITNINDTTYQTKTKHGLYISSPYIDIHIHIHTYQSQCCPITSISEKKNPH